MRSMRSESFKLFAGVLMTIGLTATGMASAALAGQAYFSGAGDVSYRTAGPNFANAAFAAAYRSAAEKCSGRFESCFYETHSCGTYCRDSDSRGCSDSAVFCEVLIKGSSDGDSSGGRAQVDCLSLFNSIQCRTQAACTFVLSDVSRGQPDLCMPRGR